MFYLISQSRLVAYITYLDSLQSLCVFRLCIHIHRTAYESLNATNRLHFVWPDVHSFDETTKKLNLHNLADTDQE